MAVAYDYRMENIMEKAFFIDNRYDFGVNKRDVIESHDRIYLGNEFCDVRLPTKNQIDHIHAVLDLPLTLIFPILSEASFNVAIDCIDYAIRANTRIDEVVFNDWGLYHFLNSKNYPLKLVTGRMINKNKRDSRISDFDLNILLTEQGIDALIAPVHEHYIEYYKKLNIERIEVDVICANLMKYNDNISITVWDKWSILSVGRICPYANHWKTYKVTVSCDNECKNKFYQYVLDNKKHISVVTHYGNAILYKSSEMNLVNCDRIVFSSFLDNDGR